MDFYGALSAWKVCARRSTMRVSNGGMTGRWLDPAGDGREPVAVVVAVARLRAAPVAWGGGGNRGGAGSSCRRRDNEAGPPCRLSSGLSAARRQAA